MTTHPAASIAVIGLGCHYPGADNPRRLWENILARRREFRRIPSCRLPLELYFSPDRSAPDKTYGARAAVIDGFRFDAVKRRLPKSTVDSTDFVHWLALETALQALEDAGYIRADLPADRTGVIVGNTLTGEQTRSQSMRLRWPYVRKALAAAALAKGLPDPIILELAATMEVYYKSVFAPITEDSLAGGLSNTIAGRICNFLDLHGGGYTVDGACASSLLAVATAAAALNNRELDLALAGGVDISLDTFEMIGFAKTGALTDKDMAVYDRRANGFIPGEGCGFVVLKRLADARADGDYVYAVLRGWGISSDGKGGITAPNGRMQALALQRAYQRAGYSLEAVAFIEGHGTGTAVGDAAELEGIALALGAADQAGDLRLCGLTSLKSLIGHTKAAAGIGGLIKTVMAVNRRILPPMAGCKEPNPIFTGAAKALYPILQGAVLPKDSLTRAGVSAMGFGGINCHVTLESGDFPAEKLIPAVTERALLASQQESELFVFGGATVAELLDSIRKIRELSDGISMGELVDLAAWLTSQQPSAPEVRGAVIAADPEILQEQLQRLEEILLEKPLKTGELWTDPRTEIWLGCGRSHTRLGFVFPGQGSQQLNMAGVLLERFTWAQGLQAQIPEPKLLESIYRPLDRAGHQSQVEEWRNELARTEIAQPAICLASLLWYRRLKQLGLDPVAVGGHSLGELTAFHAAGAYDAATLLALAALRGRVMATSTQGAHAMAGLACSLEKAEALLARADGYVVVANINSPCQVVISGKRAGVEAVIRLAEMEGVQTRRLPVSNAFHSRLMAPSAERYRDQAHFPEQMPASAVKLYSGMDGKPVPAGISMQDYFARQMTTQVNFMPLVRAMSAECDLLIEVGPGRVLSNLIADIQGETGPLCLPVEARAGNDRDLNKVLAAYFINGGRVNWAAFYENRLTRPFVPASERAFFVNPCERPLYADVSLLKPGRMAAAPARSIPKTILPPEPVPLPQIPSAIPATAAPQTQAPDASEPTAVADWVLGLTAKTTGFPVETLSPDLRLLDDLNLDSIKAAELIATAAIHFGLAGFLDPKIFSNATLGEVAAALQALLDQGADSQGGIAEQAAARPTWVRNFVMRPVVEVFLPERADSRFWQSAQVLLLHDPAENSWATAFMNILSCYQAQTRPVFFPGDPTTAGMAHVPAGFDLITVLPQDLCLEPLTEIRLHELVQGLQAMAVLSEKARSLTCMQFTAGKVQADSESAPDVATALLASLHLEQPALKIRVITIARGASPATLAPRIMAEMETTPSYAAVYYDEALKRYVPRAVMQEPCAYLPRHLHWGATDVMLVTGGAKGITAECALALAQAVGAQLALVGSSTAVNEEVRHTLGRFQSAGLTVRYYACDLTNGKAVQELVVQVQRELGPITAVIHGAAVNTPRPLVQVSAREALGEIAPKVLGAVNLCAALSAAPPKLFMGFTSIIGLTGMLRNGWYGFSNQALNLILARFQREHPGTAIQTIAFSIWGETGMGLRLGSTAYLSRLGIDAIPTAEGVRRFLQLFSHDPGARQVVVAARLGGLDTWQSERIPQPQAGGFLETILQFQPRIELLARTRLTLDTDAYVRDHVWRDSYLFPTVFGLEAMAQAAARVVGLDEFQALSIEDIRLDQPIIVNPEQGTLMEIHAQALERPHPDAPWQVRTSLRVEQTGFCQDHFSALFIWGLPAVADAPEIPAVPNTALDIQPDPDLYGRLLFQGELFRRLEAVYRLDDRECLFRVNTSGNVPPTLGRAHGPFFLGNPYARDCLLQAGQLVVAQDICLPVYIQKLTILAKAHGICYGRLIKEKVENSHVDSRAVAFDRHGGCIESLAGFRTKILEHCPENPTPEQLARPAEGDADLIRRRLQAHAEGFGIQVPEINLGYQVNWHALNPEERHQQEQTLVENLARSSHAGPMVLEWLASGKPRLKDLPPETLDVSIAHDDRVCVCAAGPGPQGCDVAELAGRSSETWLGMLGNGRKSDFQNLLTMGDSADQAGARLWAAGEALHKALGRPEISLSIAARKDAAVLFDGPQGTQVLTFPIQLTRPPERMLALVTGRPARPAENPPTLAGRMGFDLDLQTIRLESGPQGRPRLIVRMPITFKETANPSRTVYFSHFFEWMGRLREMLCYPIYPQLVEQFSSAKWGMVTNFSEIRLQGQVGAGEVIEGCVWPERNPDPSQAVIDLGFEWRRSRRDSSHERIATGRMRVTWVAVRGHGLVEKHPLPEFFQEFLKRAPLPSESPKPTAQHQTLPFPGLGREIRRAPAGPVLSSSLLGEQSFETSLEDANLVGNIYFSNYAVWQGRTRDHFCRAFTAGPQSGELRCTHSRIENLREAMPFDRIIVRMYGRAVHERGVRLHFDYFRRTPQGIQEKIAHGEHEAVWAAPDTTGQWKAAPLPDALRQALLPKTESYQSLIESDGTM